MGFLGHMVALFFFFRTPPFFSSEGLYQCIFPPTVQEGSPFSIPSLTFIVHRFFWCWGKKARGGEWLWEGSPGGNRVAVNKRGEGPSMRGCAMSGGVRASGRDRASEE